MPEDNVWLAQRRAEHAALTRLLATMADHPGRAVQGGGCGAAPDRARSRSPSTSPATEGHRP